PNSRHTSRGSALPRIETVPRVGRTSPARMRSSVVFPAPLSPRMAYKRRRSNDALTPRSAAKRPNCLIRFVTVMTGPAFGCAVLGSFTIELVSSEKPTANYRVTPTFEDLFCSVMLLGVSPLGVPLAGDPGCAGAYLDAHFACRPLA